MTPLHQSLTVIPGLRFAPQSEPPVQNGWRHRIGDWLKRLRRYGSIASPDAAQWRGVLSLALACNLVVATANAAATQDAECLRERVLASSSAQAGDAAMAYLAVQSVALGH